MDKINAEVFLKVASCGSFRKAADELGYTQAGISYIIAAMEESIGLNLFIREHGGVKLSQEGEQIFPYMKQLEGWEHQFNQLVGELKGLEKGTLRVQIFDSISIHWLPGILKRFHEDFPGIKLEFVTEEDSLRAEQMVLNGEVDCGFFLTKVTSKLDVFPLREEKMLAIVSPDSELAKYKRFPVARLGDFPYISMKYDENTGIKNIFHTHGVSPYTVFCLDNDYSAMAMVSKGLGYCIFPELLLRDIPYDLKCLEFDEPIKRTISIGTNNINTCSKACRKFIEYTIDWVKEFG